MVSILDKRHRPLRDLRISVTDRCNFRCTYCMPAEIFGPDYPFLKKKELLSFEEIERLATLFKELRCGKNTHHGRRTVNAEGSACLNRKARKHSRD
ncbi:hypothetical protein BsIDN1_64540 [Bacillus safensis]|uniref:Radical SAM core domain-containing protein n=1 Tax=Bacillus safensis TaxID=561879 RepID=A0A5S9MMD7_BACIA|nr:hypothetical protein BsIDN1_64540 [Bacillus safensis]